MGKNMKGQGKEGNSGVAHLIFTEKPKIYTEAKIVSSTNDAIQIVSLHVEE